jgi:hypothetical protein
MIIRSILPMHVQRISPIASNVLVKVVVQMSAERKEQDLSRVLYMYALGLMHLFETVSAPTDHHRSEYVCHSSQK